MKNSKVYELYRCFPKEWLTSLGHYLSTPFFSVDTKHHRLYTYLCHCLEADTPPQKEDAFAAVFPEKNYSSSYFRTLMSRHLTCLEDFILQRNSQPSALHLLQQLQELGAKKNYNSKRKRIAKELEKNPVESIRKYEELATYHTQMNRSLLMDYKQSMDDILHHFTRASHYNEVVHLVKKLKELCEIANYQRLRRFTSAYVPDFSIPQRAQEQGQNILVRIYLKAYKTLSQEEAPAAHQELTQLLVSHGNVLVSDDAHVLFSYAQNYCIRRINALDNSYYETLFTLYETGLKQGWMFEKGKISTAKYGNIVKVAVRLGLEKRAETLINKYKSNLPLKAMENAYHYNLAYIRFAQGQTEEASLLLNRIGFDDHLYGAQARCLLIKVYFEEGEIDLLQPQLDSFTKFLQRNEKLSDIYKKLFSAFIKACGKMIALKPGDKAGKKALVEEVSKQKIIAEKAWLLQKIKNG